jgi:hypothetical protein
MPSGSIAPIEGNRYLVGLMWWDDEVMATFRDGWFIIDGYEDRRYPPSMVEILEETQDVNQTL